MLSPFSTDESLFRIIRAAQLAPSVHNSQPWSFWVRADDRIELRANVSRGDPGQARWLKVADPAARELAISCGAALFNLRMALRVTGHDIATWLVPDPDDDPELLASVEVVTGRVRPPTDDEQTFYDAIPRRHTYRWPVARRRVRANILTEMVLEAAKEDAMLRVLFPFQVATWLRVTAEAERELTGEASYVAEVRRWTRGARAGLGVPKEAYGPRPVLLNPPVRDFGLAWRDDRPAAMFESHPQLLALATEGDRPLDWLRAGQALQRALLTATRYKVVASFLTQSLELADHRRESRRWPVPWTFHEHPQMLIRVGYPARPETITPRERFPDVVDLRGRVPRRVLPSGPAEREDAGGRAIGSLGAFITR